MKSASGKCSTLSRSNPRDVSVEWTCREDCKNHDVLAPRHISVHVVMVLVVVQ